MSSAQDARRKRIRLDQQALDHADDRLRSLRQTKAEAADALAAAQAKFDAISLELDDVERRRRALWRSLKETRSTFRRALWTETIPTDVLAAVFNEVANLPDRYWETFGEGRYNAERSLRPFSLAAVCSRWRNLATSIPSLWSYISVQAPFMMDEDENESDLRRVDLQRVRLLLRRSNSAPLDVLFKWNEAGATDNLQRALSLVGKHSGRLRRFEVVLPQEIPRDPLMDMFRAPTPALTHLSIHTQADWEEQAHKSYFPYAPRLQFLELAATGMSCSRRQTAFNCLRSLRLWSTQVLPGIQFAVLLAKAAPTLEELVISSSGVGDLDSISSDISLPHLANLTIGDGTDFLAHLVTPQLQRLTLDCELIDETLSPFLKRVAQGVTELTLAGEVILPSSIAILQELVNVESLTFSSIEKEPYGIADEFFVSLADDVPYVWPKLRRLSLDYQGYILPEDGDGLTQFVQSRNLASDSSAANGTEDAPCKLVEVDLRCEEIPNWVRATIERLL